MYIDGDTGDITEEVEGEMGEIGELLVVRLCMGVGGSVLRNLVPTTVSEGDVTSVVMSALLCGVGWPSSSSHLTL
jgi:hypothetical protein